MGLAGGGRALTRAHARSCDTMHTMRDRLVGHWTLLSYDTFHPDGSIGRPYGDAVGRLCYDGHGNMSGQVMRPGRQPVAHRDEGVRNVRAAYAGYVAYFGTYEVSAAGDTVTHHVQGSLNPSWVGGHQVRRLRFDGDRLILQADVTRREGTVRHVLTWQRLESRAG
jgi:hypothetical protein